MNINEYDYHRITIMIDNDVEIKKKKIKKVCKQYVCQYYDDGGKHVFEFTDMDVYPPTLEDLEETATMFFGDLCINTEKYSAFVESYVQTCTVKSSGKKWVDADEAFI